MRDRLSWYMVFLILPTILLARSLDKDRRVPYNIPSDWKALWFSNLDELQRVNEANDNNTVSNITVQLGGTAFLHCKVRNLAERTVSDAENPLRCCEKLLKEATIFNEYGRIES
ncbi:hypothetical protein ALC60_05834 [Trachymyrmex zeteki]|uniref:Ig-like domain-containing protein n=1 Tax=Mycetomoellerius zeteki TaxID=64791 RepID=A0A151X4J3_9HYME|nr:hypothetical protein ALC60_05834 [Trachymyrmex zeteki]